METLFCNHISQLNNEEFQNFVQCTLYERKTKLYIVWTKLYKLSMQENTNLRQYSTTIYNIIQYQMQSIDDTVMIAAYLVISLHPLYTLLSQSGSFVLWLFFFLANFSHMPKAAL